MTTKDRLLSEIDKLPPDILGEVLKFIKDLKGKVLGKKKVPSFKLKGQFDDIDIRKRAYE
ncbi:MAG: hypothetical protein WA705_06170 [Candidatus Ozemobacteraceae bacterium]